MTRWQPVAFADVKVGDEVKSVSPCGTEIKGVVSDLSEWRAADVMGKWLARGDRTAWTLYRRVPKPAKSTPLDVPEVGQWISATLRDGRVETFQVTGVEVCTGSSRHYTVLGDSHVRMCINRDPKEFAYSSDIIAWSPAEPPAPAEPDTFGYVGYVTEEGGGVLSVYRRVNAPGERFASVSHASGLATFSPEWPGVLSLGTFTAVTR